MSALPWVIPTLVSVPCKRRQERQLRVILEPFHRDRQVVAVRWKPVLANLPYGAPQPDDLRLWQSGGNLSLPTCRTERPSAEERSFNERPTPTALDPN